LNFLKNSRILKNKILTKLFESSNYTKGKNSLNQVIVQKGRTLVYK